MKLISIYKLIKKIIFYIKVIKVLKIFFFVCLFLILGICLFYYFKNRKEGMNERRTAIIVEPREHKALSFVLNNFCKNLDDNWDIIIVHGTKNENYIKNIIENDLKTNGHNIELINLGVENLTIEAVSDSIKKALKLSDVEIKRQRGAIIDHINNNQTQDAYRNKLKKALKIILEI